MRTLFALLMTTALLALAVSPALAVEGEPADEQVENADSVKELLNVCGTIDVADIPAFSKASVCLNAGRLTLSGGPSFQFEIQKEVGDLKEDGFTLRSQVEATGGVTTGVAVDNFSVDTLTFGAFAEVQAQAIAKVKDVGDITGSLFARLEFNNNGFKNTVGFKFSKDLSF